ncbi:uncharacterized protein LOC118645458 [Monomorium pharaonis]|uniref:uncharacterized protein LOC118645458 n=1 Tax=Monomorium pharaonis TaxID=307658 RepID=UPI001745CDCB|nr:uncharacterized protein LOC118645458 [Monomorium pharaonis]
MSMKNYSRRIAPNEFEKQGDCFIFLRKSKIVCEYETLDKILIPLYLSLNMQEININYLFCVLQYKDDKVWVKIEEPCNFHHFIVKAEETFPSLRNTDFIFTDINNAKLESDILLDYVRINPQGVIIKIKTVTNIIDISFSQTSEEINIPSTSSDRDADSSIVVSDISDIRSDSDPEEYASSSKKCKLNTTALENEIISKNV